MKERTRRAIQYAAFLSLLITLSAVLYFTYQAYVPKSADFALDAKTDRVVIEVASGGPAFGWPGLELSAVDGGSSVCALKALQFGSDHVRATLTVADAPDAPPRERSSTAAASWAKILKIRLDRLGNSAVPGSVVCTGGKQIQLRKSADLWLRGRAGKTVNLPVYAQVLVGGIVDPQGGEVALLRSGTLRASSRLKGSQYLPASNQIDLRPGDEVSVIPDSAERESLSVGIVRFDGNDLDVITNARGAYAEIRRAGLESSLTVSLPPGVLSMLQTVPLWGVITLLCTLVSGAVGLLASRSGGK